MSKIGSFLIKLFIGILPWSVVLTVFFSERLGFEGIRFLKEGILVVLALMYGYECVTRKIRPKGDTLDFLIISYILILLVVSIFHDVSTIGVIYGLRYDVGFLGVFFLLRRVLPLWGVSFYELTKIFLISGGVMLVASFLVRYVFGEMILTLAGFSPFVSVWDAGGAPPIYHGIPGASVIRFQGVLEGPNQMAFFLVIYIMTYLTTFWQYRKYRFINLIVIALLLFLLMQTYSRSGYLAIAAGAVYIFIASLVHSIRSKKSLFQMKFSWKKLTLGILSVGLVSLVLMFQFGHKFAAIFERDGSTSGHFERMYIGYLRFLQEPWGHGLATAGPASRAVAEINQNPIPIASLNPEMSYLSDIFLARNPDFVFSTEHYYIPESWYIQQLIEGGIVGTLFFGLIMMMILWSVRDRKYMFSALLGALVMNTFLHTFESVHSAFVLFILLAALIPVMQKNTSPTHTLGK